MKHPIHPPIYSQVAYDIAVKIASGEIKEAARFSGRSLMGSQYGVSSETIRRAIRLLCDVGIVSVQQNVGAVALSQQKSMEYVEQYKADNDLLVLRAEMQELTRQRDLLNDRITEIVDRISDLSNRFKHSDMLRTYEVTLQTESPLINCSIAEVQFRQRTGATIVAIRHDGVITLSPGPSTKLFAGDILMIACDITRVAEVKAFMNG